MDAKRPLVLLDVLEQLPHLSGRGIENPHAHVARANGQPGPVAAEREALELVDPGVDVRNAAGYLYRLGSNLMLDRLRSERRAAARDHDWRDAHRTVAGTDELSEEPRADDAVAARQRLEAIVAVLRELPEQTQRVFRMHKFDGLSHAQVAEALGISRSAVEKHCMAVLKRLSERLG